MSVRMFAFLRAINTGGRRIANAHLLTPFQTAGLEAVEAYQAAGNVTFRAAHDPAQLQVELEALASEAYGFEAPLFVRTAAELRSSLEDPPFSPDELAATTGKPQITFLKAAPTTAQVEAALAIVPPEDLVTFVGRVWFWLPRGGLSDSALPVARIERIVGPSTTRTVGTVERMLTRWSDG